MLSSMSGAGTGAGPVCYAVQLLEAAVTLLRRSTQAALQSNISFAAVSTKQLLAYCTVIFDGLRAGAVFGTALLCHLMIDFAATMKGNKQKSIPAVSTRFLSLSCTRQCAKPTRVLTVGAWGHDPGATHQRGALHASSTVNLHPQPSSR